MWRVKSGEAVTDSLCLNLECYQFSANQPSDITPPLSLSPSLLHWPLPPSLTLHLPPNSSKQQLMLSRPRVSSDIPHNYLSRSFAQPRSKLVRKGEAFKARCWVLGSASRGRIRLLYAPMRCYANVTSKAEHAHVVAAHMRSVPHAHTYYSYTNTKCEARNSYALPGLSCVDKRTGLSLQ